MRAKTLCLPVAACLVLSCALQPASRARDMAPSHTAVYRIPLRVHLGSSARPPSDWLPILREINFIWLSQAGICFEIHTALHDRTLDSGLDLWFDATLPVWNGYYRDGHDMRVRDDPDLRPADNPARYPAARTAAHELGHALKLRHRQNDDDNLMRSKTYGWRLHDDEAAAARQNARHLALPPAEAGQCTVTIHSESQT